MAKFLTTTGNSYFIEQIILNAESSISIVTPYIQLGHTLVQRFQDANKAGIRITLIYGKREISDKEKKSINDLDNLEIYFCANLHAKCYHNETRLIVSSMNLYEFSERNNREMGILIEKDIDQDAFRDALKEIESIKDSSIKQKSFTENETTKRDTKTKTFDLQPEYNEMWNFHLPATYALLKEKYPKMKIAMQENITIVDFPHKKLLMEISGRIDLRSTDLQFYNTITKQNIGKLSSHLPGIRFYWNKSGLNIYLEKQFHDELTRTGVEKKARKFFEIISTIAEKIEV